MSGWTGSSKLTRRKIDDYYRVCDGLVPGNRVLRFVDEEAAVRFARNARRKGKTVLVLNQWGTVIRRYPPRV